MKRIVICADGTWNRPEKNLKEDFASNVLKLARGIKPLSSTGISQQVFYDWGIGSYYDAQVGGVTGRGMQKNIMDNYRYIVQNYSPGDEIYLFGFSRGAYTVRALCGLINNCGILKRPDAKLIELAFEHYKKSSKPWAPDGEKSIEFRDNHAHPSRDVKFVGVWDTVGAMGIPISFLGFFEDKDEFYDTKLGKNVDMARHALAIDECRQDFEPTLWEQREGLDLQQMWFCGAHSDIGGSYKPASDGSLCSDYPLKWMLEEAFKAGLQTEEHIENGLNLHPQSPIHNSRRSFYRIKKKFYRPLEKDTLLHESVRLRWEGDPSYRPENLQKYIDSYGW